MFQGNVQQQQQQQQQHRSYMIQQHQQQQVAAIISSAAAVPSLPSRSSPHSGSYGSSSSGIGITSNMTSTPSLSPDSMPDPEMPLSPGRSTLITKYSRSAGTSTGGATGDSVQRRVGHIHAEQKRRYNIKNGFDMLHSLIPQLQQNPNAKLSKAAMLQKGNNHEWHLVTSSAEFNGCSQNNFGLRQSQEKINIQKGTGSI